MTTQFDDLSRVHGGGARRGVVRSTMALALAVVAALFASTASLNASPDARGNAWSSSFNDSLWTGSRRSISLSPFADWPPPCFVNCGPIFGTYVVQRIELFSSNTADLSVNKAADSTGHKVGVSGVIITERLAPSSFAADPSSWTDWVVVGERVLDSGGTHSWSLLPADVSLDAHWLPIELYRFEGSSFSMDLAAGAPAGAGATPEPSTWAMILIGFAGLGIAGYRSSRNSRRPIAFPTGIYPR